MTANGQSANQSTNGNDLFKPLEVFEEREAEWLIPEYLPKGNIVTMAGDGGSGKTTVWVNVVSAISSGQHCFFDSTPFNPSSPQKVIFLSSEDSVEIVLKRRLREAGANMQNVLTVSLQDERFKDLKFNSTFLHDTIAQVKPALVVFDPIQGFIPDGLNMGSRNDMRNLLSPLIGVGESVGTTFLLVVHTNKRAGVYGRNRIADSADIWDISRSVLIVGKTSDGTRYISHEKSNYAEQGRTILFDIQDGQPVFRGFSELHDCDFVRQGDFENRQAPQRSEAEAFILEFLKDGEQPVSELDSLAKAQGITPRTLGRAKGTLRKTKLIKYRCEGFGANKQWYISLTEKAQTP